MYKAVLACCLYNRYKTCILIFIGINILYSIFTHVDVFVQLLANGNLSLHHHSFIICRYYVDVEGNSFQGKRFSYRNKLTFLEIFLLHNLKTLQTRIFLNKIVFFYCNNF